MSDREKVLKGLEACRKTDCINCPYSALETEVCLVKYLLTDALALLKEQDDLGTELTNAMELVRKKNERIKKLEEQIETLTRWRANAGAFD